MYNFFGFIVVAAICVSLWKYSPPLALTLVVLLVAGVVWFFFKLKKEQDAYQDKLSQMTDEERLEEVKIQQERLATLTHGPVNENLVCPHCQSMGTVRSKVLTKTITSTTNTIAKIKLSSTREVAQRHCDKCLTDWEVA